MNATITPIVTPISENLKPAFPTAYIIVLNYQNIGDTLICLNSLKTLQYSNYHVVVVDNASEDGSVEVLQRCLSDEPNAFHLIINPLNAGFTGGCNVGMRYAVEQDADYIWLLNNDATVEPGTLCHLIRAAETRGGIVGSQLLFPDQRYQAVGNFLHRWRGVLRRIEEAEVREGMDVECLSGASMLIPRQVIDRIGYLDEQYYLYYEDSEYTIRARKAGFNTSLCLASKIYHKKSATIGRNKAIKNYYIMRNLLLLCRQNSNPIQLRIVIFLTYLRLVGYYLGALIPTNREVRHKNRRQYKTLRLALKDYHRGRFGPCPHSLMETEGKISTRFSGSIHALYMASWTGLALEHYQTYSQANPFPHVVLDHIFPQGILHKVLQESPQPGNPALSPVLNNMTQMGETTRQLIHFLNSSVFLRFLEELTGIEGLLSDPYLVGGGLNQMLPGEFLSIHTDLNYHEKLRLDRRLNLLLFLNQNWGEEFGGHLELWNTDRAVCQKSILPVFNRMVLLSSQDDSYYGYPNPVNCAKEQAHRSITLSYYIVPGSF